MQTDINGKVLSKLNCIAKWHSGFRKACCLASVFWFSVSNIWNIKLPFWFFFCWIFVKLDFYFFKISEGTFTVLAASAISALIMPMFWETKCTLIMPWIPVSPDALFQAFMISYWISSLLKRRETHKRGSGTFFPWTCLSEMWLKGPAKEKI